jgi:hypothetical protein
MIKEKGGHTLVAFNSQSLFSLGGLDDKQVLPTCEKYSIKTNQWKLFPALSEFKCGVSACSFRCQTLFVFAGYNRISPNHLQNLATIEKLNPFIDHA